MSVTDRISDLPDDLLCHILSHLPTKDAVKTSCLSTRWKKQWASIFNLNFSNDRFLNYGSFVMYVDRVLFFRHSLSIQQFDLHYSAIGKHDDRDSLIDIFSHIDGWIRTAIARNVVELNLFVEVEGPPRLKVYQLPTSLFMCQTLEVLKLGSAFFINTPQSWCLPKLKLLYVSGDFIPYEDPVVNLLPNLPKLEDLTISGLIKQSIPLNIYIHPVSKLKRLRIDLPTVQHYDLVIEDQQRNLCTLRINASMLKSFDLEQEVLSSIDLHDADTLDKASIRLVQHHASDLNPDFAERAKKLLLNISKVKCLSLSSHCLEVDHLPFFCNLNRLRLELHYCFSCWAELLSNSPYLEHLHIEFAIFDCGVEWGMDGCTELEWIPPALTPGCLLSSLKTICIKNFHGRQDEYDVIKYLLGNGRVLSRMTVYPYRGNNGVADKKRMRRKLSKYGKGSATCVVALI